MVESRPGANMQQNDDKRVEKLMDEHLNKKGLFRKKIAKDGSCLFRAVAEQVLLSQGLHTKVRAECVRYLREKRDLYESFIEGDFEEYLLGLQDPQSWVGQVEISALSVLYKHDFIIYQQPGEEPVNITQNGFTDQVLLCFLNGNHYDGVYPVTHAKSAAVCQSILYELLYERVCGVEKKTLAPSLRESRFRDEFVEVNQRESSEESDLDEGDDFWSSSSTGRPAGVNRSSYKGRGRGHARGGGRGSLLNKVHHCLSPFHFRNVEYDVWLRSKKVQQMRDFCMAAGMHYQTGDKCQVRLNGRLYGAHIQDVGPDEGSVFIEELGEKRTVPLWRLCTPSEDSWSAANDTSRRRSSSASNSNTDERETRPGRKVGGRLEQQHSWPPQDPKELQSLGKNANRRGDQDPAVACLSPAEREEHDLLELLHKDEENFPSLEASAQATSSDGSKRAEKKGTRKKADPEAEGPSRRVDPRAEDAKLVVSEDQDQRIPSSIKDHPNSPSAPLPAVSPSRGTRTAPGLIPGSPQATRVSPSGVGVSAQAPRTRPQTAPVCPTPPAVRREPALTPVSSRNTPVQSQTGLGSPPERTRTPYSRTSGTPAAPRTAPPTPVAPHQATLPRPEPSAGVPQQVAVTTPVATPSTPPESSPEHPEPPAAGFRPAPVTPPADPSSAPSPNVTFNVPEDVSVHASPGQAGSPGVPTPARLPPSDVPPREDSSPALPTYPPYPPLSTMPIPQLPPSAPTPSFSHPTEPRPYEPAVPGPAGAPGPGYPSQHPFSLAQICQDPLYPGVPTNDRGELVHTPPGYVDRSGQDLPRDLSVLTFFFNLGVKAFMYPTLPPITYLMPLTQAYQMHLKTSVPWQPENSPGPEFPAPSSSPSIAPIGQFGVRGVAHPAPPPAEAFSHRVAPVPMPLGVNAPFPNVYAGMFLAPPAGHPVQYPPPGPSVGLPLPPPEHGGMMGGAQNPAGGAVPDVQRIAAPSQGAGFTWLANGNRPEAGGVSFGTASVGDEWEPERAESADLTRGQSYFSRNRSSRHGQEYRGNKGRGSRGRRDYSGGEAPYHRGSGARGRGRGYTQHTYSRAGYTGAQFTPTANS